MIPQESSGISNSLISSLDFLQPLYSKKLYDPFNGQGVEMLNMLYDMGAKEGVIEETGEHWEEDRYASAITVKANVTAPSAGANLVFKLVAAEIDSTTRESYPIVGNIIRYAMGGGATYEIIDKTDDGTDTTITARPLKATTAQALTANDKFYIVSATAPEFSDTQAMQTSFQTKYTWRTQNIRTDGRISGNALTSATKTEVTQNGRAIPSYWTIQTIQDEYRHLLKCVGAQVWGQSTTNTGLTSYSNGTTSGMIEQFTARAANEITGGTLTQADFSAIETTLSANWSESNFLCLLSGKSYAEISADAISDFNQSNMNAVNNVLSNALFGVSAFTTDQLMATYTFGGLTVNGKNFALKRLTLFDDPTGAGVVAAGADRDYGFVLPAGKTQVNDSKGQTYMRNTMMLKYKKHNGIDRFMKMWYTGGSSPAQNTSVDDSQLHMLTEVGFDFANLQQAGLFKKA